MAGLNLGWQTVAYLIALVEIILALFSLLDWRRRGHRHFAISMLILAINTFALGRLEVVSGEEASYLPALLLALTSPLIVPVMLATLIALPDAIWPPRKWSNVAQGIIAGIAAIPVILTIIDIFRTEAHLSGAALWFSPLGPRYPGGFVDKSVYTSGILSGPVNLLIYGGLGIPMLVLAVVTLLRPSKYYPWTRHFAAVLLASQAFAIIPNILAMPAIGLPFNLLASALYLFTVAVAAFRTSATEAYGGKDSLPSRRTLRLQTRLTLLALIITLPLLAAMGVLLTDQARTALEQNARASLEAANRTLTDSAEIWLANNTRILRTLAANSNIQSMDPERQAPELLNLVAIYPDIYLVGVINMDGINTARSDGRPSEDYSERVWFLQAKRGLPVGIEVSLAESGGVPVMTAAAPVRNPNGEVIGVVMFSGQLNQIWRLVNSQNIGSAGARVMVIDENDRLIATSDTQASLMADLHYLPTVQTLRDGKLGAFRYLDSRGDYWNAYLNVLSNDWGIIVLQPERTLFAPIRNFQRLSAIILTFGALILLWLTWSSIRQAMGPVRELTETATAIAGGDLSRTAAIYQNDELGVLAQSFNNMTSQLRDLITGLEARVSERTRDLERRAVQLQVTADVAREAAGIHNREQLLNDAVQLISDRFGFYHAGIFLLEGSSRNPAPEARGYAVLKAASSEGGQRMLKRGHRLAAGDRPGVSQGIVGFVAGTGQPRIALDVGREPVYFNNPDLPLTRSEMAVPLKIQDRVIGVLDVQSRKPSAFDDQDLSIMQVLADQLAMAIVNADLIAESQRSLDQLESLYGQQVQQSWKKRLGDQPLRYRMAGGRVDRLAVPTGETVPADAENDAQVIEMPIEIRNTRLGMLRLRRENQEGWPAQDRALVEQAVERLAQALENARLMEEIQRRAHQEELINQMVTRTQSTLNLDNVLRTAVEEIVRVVNASRVQIRLLPTENGHTAMGDYPENDPEAPSLPDDGLRGGLNGGSYPGLNGGEHPSPTNGSPTGGQA